MITLRVNEILWTRDIPREIKLTELSHDTSGVTLHFRWHEKDKGMTVEQAKETRESLGQLFPQKFIESNQMRLRLGEFIDIFEKIY